MDILSEMDKLKELLLKTVDEPIAEDNDTIISGSSISASIELPRKRETLFKRAAALCKYTNTKLHDCEKALRQKSRTKSNTNSRTESTTEDSSELEDSGKDDELNGSIENNDNESLASSSTLRDVATSTTTSKNTSKCSVAFKLRPIEDLLDVTTKSSGDSDSHTTPILDRRNRQSSPPPISKTPLGKLKPILKRAAQTLPAAGPLQQGKLSHVRVVLRRLPTDLSKLLQANGLDKKLQVQAPLPTILTTKQRPLNSSNNKTVSMSECKTRDTISTEPSDLKSDVR